MPETSEPTDPPRALRGSPNQMSIDRDLIDSCAPTIMAPARAAPGGASAMTVDQSCVPGRFSKAVVQVCSCALPPNSPWSWPETGQPVVPVGHNTI